MENLIVAIALYIVIVAIAHCPKSVAKSDTDPTVAIDYFPQVEETTEPQAVAPAKPKATIANLIKEEATKTAIGTTALSIVVPMATVPAQPVEVFTVANDLTKLGVRDLYALAKGKVKGYKKLSKAQLIQALA